MTKNYDKKFPFLSNLEHSSVTRNLFADPFDPKLNFAIEDPLLFSSHPDVLKTGIDFAKYFATGSLLSPKSGEFFEKKLHLEKQFSKKIQKEASLIVTSLQNSLYTISKVFPINHPFLLPSLNPPKIIQKNIHYFSEKNLGESLSSLLKKTHHSLQPIVYLEKSSLKSTTFDFLVLKELKEKYPFFLIIENTNLFGTEGFLGYGSLKNASLIDLLITQIPKTFGKLLTIISSKKNTLQLLVNSLSGQQIFPNPSYLGMLSSIIDQMDIFSERRTKLNLLKKNLQEIFPKIKIPLPYLTIPLNSLEEKKTIHNILINKGFLLPYNSLSINTFSLDLYLNYLQETTSFLSIKHCIEQYENQHITETI